MTQYFKKLPIISYANTPSINIMARVNLTKLALQSKQSYYAYVIDEGERADVLSYNYYKSPDYTWLIHLSNQVIDPYYDYPVSFDDLNGLITAKYGSTANAQNQIVSFKTNWESDDSIISTATYAALAAATTPTQNLAKYWAPEIDNNNNIVGYVRKQEDWYVTTNQVVQITLLYSFSIETEDEFIIDTEDNFDIVFPVVNNGAPFQQGEQVSQNGVTVAVVESISTDGGTLVLKHVFGNITTTSTLVGESSGAEASLATAVLVSQTIPDAELVYWSPVTAYDSEHEKNSNAKTINLLDNRYAGQATKELKKLFT